MRERERERESETETVCVVDWGRGRAKGWDCRGGGAHGGGVAVKVVENDVLRPRQRLVVVVDGGIDVEQCQVELRRHWGRALGVVLQRSRQLARVTGVVGGSKGCTQGRGVRGPLVSPCCGSTTSSRREAMERQRSEPSRAESIYSLSALRLSPLHDGAARGGGCGRNV